MRILRSDEFDYEALARRVAERRRELAAEIERAEKKLANPGFRDKAPADVVAAEEEKLASYRRQHEALT